MFKLKIIYYYLGIVLRGKFNDRIRLESWQQRKLKSFTKKILIKSAFYKRFIVNGSLNLNTIPIIEKSEFMDNFNAINTVGIDRETAMELAIDAETSRDFKSEINGVTVGLSTGTSGKRGIFLVNETERAQWVAMVMARVLTPRVFKKQKIAFFLRANSNLYSSIQSNLFEFNYFDIFKPIDELTSELNKYKPDVLAGQPSILMEICKAQKFGSIAINPSKIISFAEVLHSDLKLEIEQIFGIKPMEVYQCTEGFLGVSCSEGNIHLNEDAVIIEKEWLNSTQFHPIITDFTRTSQPIIKYRLNDILEVLNEPCPCGSSFTALSQIIGRDDDVLIFENCRLLPDVISRKIALQTDAFLKYQIVQVNNNSLKITIDCEDELFPQTCEHFKKTLSELINQQCQVSTLNFEFIKGQAIEQGNKLRKIRRISHEN